MLLQTQGQPTEQIAGNMGDSLDDAADQLQVHTPPLGWSEHVPK
jgi:hypothetical protein